MRLRSVWISEYKNLKDFSISFEREGFIDIFVGKNGSGKSNFLEALIEIFDHLFESERGGTLGECFSYKIEYELNEATTSFEWSEDKKQLVMDGKERKSAKADRLPDNVLVYYSGQNRHVAELIDRYETRFRNRIKGANLTESPAFIGVGPDYRKILILLLLLLPNDNRARQFIEAKLGILGTSDSIKLVLSEHYFARRGQFDHLDPKDLFWGLEGISRTFLDDLVSCIEGGATPGALHNRETNQYQIVISAKLFRKVFGKRDWDEIFRLFNNLKILGMIEDISMGITLSGINSSNLGLFSDGQFQSVYLFAIAELFKEKNCLTLLDEPDAFLHPEWQFDFLRQTEAISAEAACSNHILLSSHSAATLIPTLEKKIKYFDLKEGNANCYSVPKRIAIEKLSSKLIRYTEEEQLLSILNAIQIESKSVFFTEGSIDPIIIREAWHRIYGDEPPFIPFYAFSCTYLSQLLRDDRILNEMEGRPMFGLFDFDKAYDQWNGLTGEVIQPNVETGMCKVLSEKASYAFLLPLPKNAKIRSQVIKNDETGETFGGDSLCEIEHLFFGDDKTFEFFETERTLGGGEKVVFKSDSQKEPFAKEVIPSLDNSYFAVFKPIFEIVKEKISNHAN